MLLKEMVKLSLQHEAKSENTMVIKRNGAKMYHSAKLPKTLTNNNTNEEINKN